MAEPVKRAASIEEPTNAAIFVPIAMGLVPIFAKLKITPNMVSITGLTSGVTAAFAYYYYDSSYLAALLGLFLMAVWHVMDCADGQLARFTNTQSELGKIIDGACDYIVFIALHISLALALSLTPLGSDVWYLVSFAGLMHASQAASYELQRQEFEFWGMGLRSAAQPELAEPSSDQSFGGRLASRIARFYAAMQKFFAGMESSHRAALIAHMANPATDVDGFRVAYQKAYAPMVLKWGFMCSHYRTYTIFVFCISGYPVGYFVLWGVVMPLVHLALVFKQRSFNRKFIATLIKA